ncbi:MAG: type II 3-dehydroquinate dehydratase, partial [Candidatus Manganitrophaceae bacterium]
LQLGEIDRELEEIAQKEGASIEIFQSNSEGALVDRIQDALGRFDAIVINPAAYTHTSVAIRDALLAVGIPTIEVHLSNIHARESFRKKSLIADLVVGQVSGFGPASYRLGLLGAIEHLTKTSGEKRKKA